MLSPRRPFSPSPRHRVTASPLLRVTASPLLPFSASAPHIVALLGYRLGLLDRLFNRANHIESLFGQVIMFAVDDFEESLDCVFELHVFALQTGELLGNVERL